MQNFWQMYFTHLYSNVPLASSQAPFIEPSWSLLKVENENPRAKIMTRVTQICFHISILCAHQFPSHHGGGGIIHSCRLAVCTSPIPKQTQKAAQLKQQKQEKHTSPQRSSKLVYLFFCAEEGGIFQEKPQHHKQKSKKANKRARN
jgi:hypothetical protein